VRRPTTWGEAHDSSSCPSVVPLLLRRKVAAEVEDEGNVPRRGWRRRVGRLTASVGERGAPPPPRSLDALRQRGGVGPVAEWIREDGR
jgi:hypothetical protein